MDLGKWTYFVNYQMLSKLNDIFFQYRLYNIVGRQNEKKN